MDTEQLARVFARTDSYGPGAAGHTAGDRSGKEEIALYRASLQSHGGRKMGEPASSEQSVDVIGTETTCAVHFGSTAKLWRIIRRGHDQLERSFRRPGLCNHGWMTGARPRPWVLARNGQHRAGRFWSDFDTTATLSGPNGGTSVNLGDALGPRRSAARLFRGASWDGALRPRHR